MRPPIGAVWLVAKTPTHETYPCYCDENLHWKGPRPKFCDCYGRTDLVELKHYCCAVRRAAPRPGARVAA